ncbi:MAG: putative metalloprotease CJM1_0395 family protein [Wenzhouxiangella sp.]|jgi:hypothetical protein|nr:putative metalloprotease CJM1_0395 family protein [Wenzhouxiangella sp.]
MQVGAINVLPPQPVSSPNRQSSGSTDAQPEQSSDSGSAEETSRSDEQSAPDRGPLELTEAEQAQVRELQQRDREVRAHELAHVAAGGPYVTRPATYQYQTGPDGRRYAVGGEVTIDTSVPSDPREALAKAQIIERAALAPVEPSQQDYRVAAKARQMAADARREIAAERLGQTDADPAPEATQASEDTESTDSSMTTNRLPMATAQSLEPTSRISLFA